MSAALIATPVPAFAATPAQTLSIGSRVLEVQGKPAPVFGITNALGHAGLVLDREDGFNVRLRNDSPEETLIHWHGLTPPFAMDGNMLSQSLIALGDIQDYSFALHRSGSNWMHSHHRLHEARLHGALRDTVLVPAMDTVTVAFDADNPGDWPLHCHNLFHMAAGMMTTLRYL